MLERLTVQSVGGVKSADLTFGRGLTVITGESGAGKSSLLRALEMIAGRRSSASCLRGGDEKAVARALFITDASFEDLPEGARPIENELILSREYHRGGRGKSQIQNMAIPLTDLSRAAERLITLQSQFAQLELLDPERQLALVDAAGGTVLAEVRRKFTEQFAQLAALSRARHEDAAREEKLQRTYGAAEEVLHLINSKALADRTLSELETELSLADEALKRAQRLTVLKSAFENSEGSGLKSQTLDLCYQLIRESDTGDSNNLEDAFVALQTAFEQFTLCLKETSSQNTEALEEQIRQSETLLGRWRKACRLAGVTADQLPEWLHQAEDACVWLRDLAPRRAERGTRIKTLTDELVALAGELSELRSQAAQQLAEEVNAHLADLAMGDCTFAVQIEKSDKIKISGGERVVFTLRRGTSAPLPVAKNASGGELSRTLLALQLALPRDLLPPTVVFDEVEAGLGGKTALLTGLKLQQLSKTVQVILVTHEAIIAAQADAHWGVRREGDETRFVCLQGEERAVEIARMLSGRANDEKSLHHARHLLNQSAQNLDVTDFER